MLRRAIWLIVAAVVLASGCASQTASTEFVRTIPEMSDTALAGLIPDTVTGKLASENTAPRHDYFGIGFMAPLSFDTDPGTFFCLSWWDVPWDEANSTGPMGFYMDLVFGEDTWIFQSGLRYFIFSENREPDRGVAYFIGFGLAIEQGYVDGDFEDYFESAFPLSVGAHIPLTETVVLCPEFDVYLGSDNAATALIVRLGWHF